MSEQIPQPQPVGSTTTPPAPELTPDEIQWWKQTITRLTEDLQKNPSLYFQKKVEFVLQCARPEYKNLVFNFFHPELREDAVKLLLVADYCVQKVGQDIERFLLELKQQGALNEEQYGTLRKLFFLLVIP